MNLFHKLTAIVAMLCTAVTALTAVIFCAAAGANSDAESIRRLKLWMLACGLGSLVFIGIAIWLLTRHRPGPSAIVAIIPTVLMGATFLVKLLR